MAYQRSIKYMKNNEIFNQYFKEEIAQLHDNFGTSNKNNLFEYKSYKMEDTYRKDEYYIVDLKNPVEYEKLKKLPENPRLFIYSSELCYLSGKVFQTEDYVDTIDIIKHIHSLDSNIGNKMLDTYHFVCADSDDMVNAGESVLVMQKVLHKYLKENNFYQTVVEIDYDPNDSASVTRWFQNVPRQDYDKFPRYNDSDYTQFLFVGKDNQEYHIIEDSSSDKLFIYKGLNENSGSWYMTSRNNFKDSNNDMHDALYESHQYIAKNIEENINDFTLIAQFDDGKLINATARLDDLNLIQSYIYGQLYVENKVKLDIDDSFEYMLANYRKDHDYHNDDIDEMHFLPFLQEIKENPGSLYYHNYQYHKNHDNNPELDRVENGILQSTSVSKNYTHLNQLSSIHQQQIAQYIEEKMEKFSNYDSMKAHLTAIKNVLSNTKDVSNDMLDDDDIIITRRPANTEEDIVEEVKQYNESTGKVETIRITHLKF